MALKQPVKHDYTYNGEETKAFAMIDNYVYLYHTDTLIAIPTFPDSIADSMGTSFNETTPLGRSAPIYSYSHSGPRSLSISLSLHRDLMYAVNTASSCLKIPEIEQDDYVDILVKQLSAAALPRYAAEDRMVNPPVVAVRFGEDVFCKGVVTSGVTVTYSGPILRTNKYAQVTVDFTINEIDPYDADSVMICGQFRGLSTSLERRVYK